jgi:protein involved in polysaccharide export with SLBB domain
MRLKTLKVMCLFILFTGLAACAPNRVINPAPLSQLQQQEREHSVREYVITQGDELDIRFRNNPELNELRLPVRPDGRIMLQIIDEIKAAGLTVSQLKALLTEKYAVEIRKPEITVTVRNFTSQRVFVDGEVLTPGIIELRGPTTVMDAIALARGARETARLSNIIVIRKDFEGKPMAANLDIRKVINGTDLSQNIYLMPYDIVYVPKSNIALIDKFVSEYINTVVPGGFPGFAGFSNPYTYSLGGFTKVYPDRPYN